MTTTATPTIRIATPWAADAQKVRQALRAELGITSKQVTVRGRKCTYSHTVEVDVVAPGVNFAAVEAIALRIERVRRCEASGDTLLGGNVYVQVKDYAPMDRVEMEIKPTPTRVVMFGSTPGGWFERNFPTAEKARAHAARKGWAVA
jgi:hypothetical protein